MEQQILDLYFEDKLKQKEIAERLNISKYKVSRTVGKDTRYVLEKERRKELNKVKHSQKTKEIMKRKREKQQRQNNEDYLALKKKHNQASAELSKGKRLSNMAYRDWNKSAFKYNLEKNRYEFREELGRSYDVPKYIKVEI